MTIHSKDRKSWLTKLDRIGELSTKDKGLIFNNIGHIIDVDMLKEQVKNMEIQLEKANKDNLKIENNLPKKIEKNDIEKNAIEKIYSDIDNLKKEILEIKKQVKDIVDIIQTIMIINK